MLGRLPSPPGLTRAIAANAAAVSSTSRRPSVRSVAARSVSCAPRVAAARTSGANSSTIPRFVLVGATRAVASTPSAISRPTPRPLARWRENTGPSASAERTMSAYVVSEKSWAGVMLPGFGAVTSSTHASST